MDSIRTKNDGIFIDDQSGYIKKLIFTENGTANRDYTLTLPNANTSITLDNWFDQSVKTTSDPSFQSLAVTGGLAVGHIGGTLGYQSDSGTLEFTSYYKDVSGPRGNFKINVCQGDGGNSTNVFAIYDDENIEMYGTESITLYTPGLCLDNSSYIANKALTLDSDKFIVSSSTTDTELGYVHGVTSAIQTQLNTKYQSGDSPTFTEVFCQNLSSNGAYNQTITMNCSGVNIFGTGLGLLGTVSATYYYLTLYANPTLTGNRTLQLDVNNANRVLSIYGTSKIDQDVSTGGSPSLTALTISGGTASRAIYYNASKQITASSVTNTELGYLSGVTSAIQTQLDGKLSSGGGALAVSSGGTGQTTYTNGQLLIGNTTGNTLAKATLTGTSNQITVTNGTGTITLSLPQNIDTAATPTFNALQCYTTGSAVASTTYYNTSQDRHWEVGTRLGLSNNDWFMIRDKEQGDANTSTVRFAIDGDGASYFTAFQGKFVEISANYTAITSDYCISCISRAGGININLPTAANSTHQVNGYNYHSLELVICDTSGEALTKNITISRASSDLINGATSYVINTAYASVTLKAFRSATWIIISKTV